MSATAWGGPLLQALMGDTKTAALFTREAELAAMLRVEAALAAAQAEARLIPAAAAEAVAAACTDFRPDWDDLTTGLLQDGVMVPALVRALRATVAPEWAACLHRGATSQDIVDSALLLRLRPALGLLETRLAVLLQGLDDLDRSQGGRALMAHTRMQAALPFAVADKLAAWTHPLRRHRERLQELRPRLLVVQLGGPVGTRAELGPQAEAVVAGVARRLGLEAGVPWHSARDGIGELAAWLSLVAGSLGKIGQDVALLAQSEVAAVRVAGGGGSSAMPHKSNPVAAELLVAAARYNAGSLGTLHQALVHENERSGAAWTLEWMVLPQMLTSVAGALTRAAALVAALEFA